MIVSINQPAYLPWLGYFDRIIKSDVHIVLDNVQMEHNTKTSFTNRNKIRTNQGWCWLTVPIKHPKTAEEALINHIAVNDIRWKKKHYRSIVQSYGKLEGFKVHQEWFEWFYNSDWDNLAQLLRVSTEYFLEFLSIKTSIIYSSELGVTGQKDDLVMNLCKYAGADVYLSGPFGRDYLDIEKFNNHNIEVKFHDYEHQEYSQVHGEFIPYMSIIDLLFNHTDKPSKIIAAA